MRTSGRGRPRSEQARIAVLAAARDALLEQEFETLSIGDIAVRAGVGKQTIYRWWASKSAVIADAVLEEVIPLPAPGVPDTGDIRADLDAWMRTTIDLLTRPGGEGLVRALAVAVATDPAAGEALYGRLVGPHGVEIIRRLERAQAAGQVRADAKLRGASDALAGFAVFLVLVRQPVTIGRAMDLLETVLNGIESTRRPSSTSQEATSSSG